MGKSKNIENLNYINEIYSRDVDCTSDGTADTSSSRKDSFKRKPLSLLVNELMQRKLDEDFQNRLKILG